MGEMPELSITNLKAVLISFPLVWLCIKLYIEALPEARELFLTLVIIFALALKGTF